MWPPLSRPGGFEGSLHPALLSPVINGFHPFHWLHCALLFEVQFGHGSLNLVKHGHVTSSQLLSHPLWTAIDVTLKNGKINKFQDVFPILFSNKRQVVLFPGPIWMLDLQKFMHIVLHVVGHTD